MKFNKSEESDYYYVEGDDGNVHGKIILDGNYIYFDQGLAKKSNSKELKIISDFMTGLEFAFSIDTTSTFTSNSQ